MTEEKAETPWPARLVEVVAEEVRRHRLARGMSTQQLSDACAELGLPIARSVLANFETKRRPTISVPEVHVLAAALEVPPILLLFPLGHRDRVESLPGKQVPTWDALKWFAGRDRPRSADWRQSEVPPQLWEEHDVLVERLGWTINLTAQEQVRGEPDQEALQRLQVTFKTFADALRTLRAHIRALRLTPPALPEALHHLDQPEQGD